MRLNSSLPKDYDLSVYAGVLGKIIGVYLGRPFEGWPYREILEKLGEVNYYVHDRLGHPLVVTDDDISGTFTFLRALEDNDYDPDITARQIGETWMNYLIEERTVLWWGGLGMSTEHTAYLRMKNGIPAPQSGSAEVNSKVVSEQIGSQIFIDGWGMICPDDPESAVDFAKRAASVSHDGEAIYGAQIIAAIEALAFSEKNLDLILDAAIQFIPKDSVTYELIQDLRDWYAEGLSWQDGFHKIEAKYGYDKYGGNCHIIPNHAIVIHALLHSNGNFQRGLMIANTCGWDTDCNSGNVGCILGILLGMEGILAGPDWLGPIADRLYIPTADGGRCVSDAVTETLEIVKAARKIRGFEYLTPKNGAKFNFAFPHSVQGFQSTAKLSNSSGELLIEAPTGQTTVLTETFPAEAATHKTQGYGLYASPTLYPGQTVTATIQASKAVKASLCIQVLTSEVETKLICGPLKSLPANESINLSWDIPDVGGAPICSVGLQIQAEIDSSVSLDRLTWDGTPTVTFNRLPSPIYREAWVKGISDIIPWGEDEYRLVQNEGTGLFIQGTRNWTNYTFEAEVTPHMASRAGIAVRVQGMRRYYALLLCRDKGLQIVKCLNQEAILAEAPIDWKLGETHNLRLAIEDNQLLAYLDGVLCLSTIDNETPLRNGAVGLILTEGRAAYDSVSVGEIR